MLCFVVLFCFVRALLSSKCHGVTKAVVTQANTPVGSKVVYDGEKRKPLQVTPALFSVFPKVKDTRGMGNLSTGLICASISSHSDSPLPPTFLQDSPFQNTTWDSCSVVGNGGILVNSSCGERIDSTQFVIR